jgi:hypothetical protein
MIRFVPSVTYERKANVAIFVMKQIKKYVYYIYDRLCGLLGTVPGYRYRGPGFDSRRYHIFWEVVGLERGPLSLVRITEELFQGNSGSGLESRD